MNENYDYFGNNMNNNNYQQQQPPQPQQQQPPLQQQIISQPQQPQILNDFKLSNNTIITNNINGSNNVQNEHLNFIDPIYRKFCTDIGLLVKQHTKSPQISRSINKNKQFKLMFDTTSINITYLLLLINNLEIKHNVKCSGNLFYEESSTNGHVQKISHFGLLYDFSVIESINNGTYIPVSPEIFDNNNNNLLVKHNNVSNNPKKTQYKNSNKKKHSGDNRYNPNQHNKNKKKNTKNKSSSSNSSSSSSDSSNIDDSDSSSDDSNNKKKTFFFF